MVDDAIDLHGFQPREIPDVVLSYLEEAARAGHTEVRLIHGRGKGVQRRRVQEILAEHRLVLAFRDAPHTRGGWGATVAWLRRVDADGCSTWLWQPAGDGADTQWRALIQQLARHADTARFTIHRDRPGRLAVTRRFPFIARRRDAPADRVIDALREQLGDRLHLREKGRRILVRVPVDERVVTLLRRPVTVWRQHLGEPENPCLLAADKLVVDIDGPTGRVAICVDDEAHTRLAAKGVALVSIDAP